VRYEGPPLADLLTLAILEHGPESGSRLARRVHVRKRDVLAELRARPRFEQDGRGCNSTWRPRGWDPRGTGRESRGTGSEPERGQEGGAGDRERLEALERRVARLERLLAEPETPGPNGDGVVIPGQTTVYEMLGETPG
jgi:hypothetical protein